MVQLYGEEVIPADVVQLFNRQLGVLKHACANGADRAEIGSGGEANVLFWFWRRGHFFAPLRCFFFGSVGGANSCAILEIHCVREYFVACIFVEYRLSSGYYPQQDEAAKGEREAFDAILCFYGGC